MAKNTSGKAEHPKKSKSEAKSEAKIETKSDAIADYKKLILEENLSVIEAGQKLLHARFHMVKHYLIQVMQGIPCSNPGSDPGTVVKLDSSEALPGERSWPVEPVHQLRVSTRRAGASLRLLRPYLSPKPFRSLRKILHQLRALAAPARDADVFLLALQANRLFRKEANRPAYFFLLGLIGAQRNTAQQLLIANTPDSSLPKILAKLQKKCFETADEFRVYFNLDVPGIGRSWLEPVLSQLNDAENLFRLHLDPIPDSVSKLHELRILGKRVRYTMELLAHSLAGPWKEERLPMMEQVQEILGDINDCDQFGEQIEAIRHLVRGILQESDRYTIEPVLQSLRQQYRRKMLADKNLFLDWVQKWSALQSSLTIDRSSNHSSDSSLDHTEDETSHPSKTD